jgi:adenylate cyclase
MTRLLVADDEADLEILIRQKFRQKIREGKYEFVFASNGKVAFDMMNEDATIDIILSDINMPEMDGLSLLTKLAEAYPLIKVVMVSAYGDMDNIRSAMNKGAFDFVTKPVNFDDLELTIEKTISHVTQLKQTMQAIKENNILKMYVDHNVLKFMNSKEFEHSLSANEILDASVAFIDICSFTSISEKETPNNVVTMLNKYFDIIAKEIIAQGGIIDKFIGDCVMAVFKGDYHSDRAIEACIEMRDKIQALPEENNFKPQVSIGINCGEMVSGNIGSATLRRLDFTVIGDVVNTSQRLQSIAKPNQILISESCYNKINQSFKCERLGNAFLKNKEKEVAVYEVIR